MWATKQNRQRVTCSRRHDANEEGEEIAILETICKINMNFAQHFSLGEDMALAAEVRKHPCLYNRNFSGYKKEEPSSKAWQAIGDVLGLDKDVCARKFENLKKRYSKKRCTAKKARDPVSIAKAKKTLESYSFLKWLNLHIRIREVTTAEEDVISTETENIDNGEGEDNEQALPPTFRDNSITDTVVEDKCVPIEAVSHINKRPRYSQGEMTTISSTRERRSDDRAFSMTAEQERFSLEPPSMGYSTELSSSSSLANKANESGTTERNSQRNTADQAFGNMVAAELSSFPQHIKYCIKHEINNILFKYHTAEFESQNNNVMPAP
eukprot:gene17306-19039_t